MSPATTRSDWHRVGAGLSVRFTRQHERFDAEWTPRLPTAREIKRVADPDELALIVAELYGAALRGFCRAIEKALGGASHA